MSVTAGSSEVLTERSSIAPERYWRYWQTARPAFDAVVFDEQQLEALNCLDGTAQAGRGNTFFINFHNSALVLRHYRRGGFAQHVSKQHYVFTGLESTRAMREFDVLARLQELQLPAPAPFACQVIRRGLFYSASLVTYRISGVTLAERLFRGELPETTWQSIGRTVAGFHKAGVNHADLNAHNILLDQSDRAALIDFDRARIVSLPSFPTDRGWCLGNILRLQRSLNKLPGGAVGSAESGVNWADGFRFLQDAWRDELLA